MTGNLPFRRAVAVVSASLSAALSALLLAACHGGDHNNPPPQAANTLPSFVTSASVTTASYDGTSDDLRRNADVREFYLGLNTAQGATSMKDVKHYKRRKRWLS